VKNIDYDYVIIGSGFGGAVSALRLSEKGYKVLVIEKGKNFKSTDFPESNWNIKRWLWVPFLRFFGFFKLTFFRHVTIFSGVGVGGGSLVYANTLPIPKDDFFNSSSWSGLADWKTELSPFYKIASQMLGIAKNPHYELGDNALKQVAEGNNIADKFELTDVGVYFGKADETVADPYFNGAGPERSGCNFCGGCMVGCRYNAKNSLDKNYLYLAKENGAEIISESEVFDVKPIGLNDGSEGYIVKYKDPTKWIKRQGKISANGVVFSGGVLGTIPLLLKLKETSLPNLSPLVGRNIRTNSESLLGVTTTKPEVDFSKGIAITSILHTDEHSHIEPVRYPSGSGFWRLQMVPMIDGKNWFTRLFKVFYELIRHPIKWLKLYTVKDWAKKTQILLFMQTINSTLKFEKGWFRMKSKLDIGEAPTAFMPKSRELAKQFSEIVDGTPCALFTETIFGIPTTAHILGGATMGKNNIDGVIDSENKVFGYKNMLVCDGSMISANPGVNPSLTITAISEYAMDKIQTK
jgi:cholesterol oxidase